MDHSSIIYLMGPDGLVHPALHLYTDAKALAADLARRLQAHHKGLTAGGCFG